MATSVTQGLNDEQAGGNSYRIARRVTLDESVSVKAKLGPAGEGRILDISETGLASQAPIPIQPGSKITVDFDIPEGGHIRTEAQVVWRTVDKRVGLRFLRMSEPTRLRLRAWIDSLAGPSTASSSPEKTEASPRSGNEFFHLVAEIKASQLYLDSALALLVERAAELTGATGAALAIGPPDNMICRATLGDAPDVGTVINPDSKLTSECIRTRSTVHVVDTDTDGRVDPFVCRDLNMRSAVLAPTFPSKGDKNFTVVLEMFSSRAKNFTPEHIQKLEQLAEVAGVLALDGTGEAHADEVKELLKTESTPGDKESLLFAQDELDHLVDRFISDLKIGTPAKSGSPAASASATSTPDVKKPSTFESNLSRKSGSHAVSAPVDVPKTSRLPENKPASSLAPPKQQDWKPVVGDKGEVLEIVSIAEPVSAPPPKHVERNDFTLSSQQAVSTGSNAPIIAVVVLVMMALVGGGFYFLHNSKKTAPSVAQEAAPPPVSTPAAATDPNTSALVTAPAATTQPPPTASVEPEPAKKAVSEPKPEKENKETEAAKEKEKPAPAPIVLATGRRYADEAPLPMSAPAIPMGGASGPSANIPVMSARPSLAAQTSTGVVPGVLIHRVNPRYPTAARSSALSGEVVLKGRITKEGNVEDVKPVSGNPMLTSAAADAVRQWKYKPYMVNGKAIDMDTTFRIEFALPK